MCIDQTNLKMVYTAKLKSKSEGIQEPTAAANCTGALKKVPLYLQASTVPAIVESPVTSESRKESRKISHSVIEKRRREKINTCLSKLKSLVPGCQAFGDSIQKLTILELTVDYILALQGEKGGDLSVLEDAAELFTRNAQYPLSPSPSHSHCLDSGSPAESPKKMAITSILN